MAAHEHGLSGRLGDPVLSVVRVPAVTGEGEVCNVDGCKTGGGEVSCVVGTMFADPKEKEGSVSANGIDGTSGTPRTVTIDSCSSSKMVDTVVVTSAEGTSGNDCAPVVDP